MKFKKLDIFYRLLNAVTFTVLIHAFFGPYEARFMCCLPVLYA